LPSLSTSDVNHPLGVGADDFDFVIEAKSAFSNNASFLLVYKKITSFPKLPAPSWPLADGSSSPPKTKAMSIDLIVAAALTLLLAMFYSGKESNWIHFLDEILY
jgi:hypothetical protein